eukprot:1140267-Pelagomonas_calceolata.AAC.12
MEQQWRCVAKMRNLVWSSSGVVPQRCGIWYGAAVALCHKDTEFGMEQQWFCVAQMQNLVWSSSGIVSQRRGSDVKSLSVTNSLLEDVCGSDHAASSGHG